MSIFSWLFDAGSNAFPSNEPMHTVNTNGLPMVNDFVDIVGNPYGTDMYDQSHHDTSSWTCTESFGSADIGCASDSGCLRDTGCASDIGCSMDTCAPTDWGCTDSPFD